MTAGAEPRFVAIKTVLAMAWFSAMFFLAGPWLVLRASGTDPAAAIAAAKVADAVPLLAASALVAWVVLRFVVDGRGTPVPIDPPRRFVRDGVWGRTRNPMYLAYAAVVAAEAWWLRSGALAVYALAFFGLMHAYVAGVEEPGLRRRFGEAYEDYCAEVPRWLSLRSFAPPSRSR